MGSIIGWLIRRGMPAKAARPAAIGGLVVLLLAFMMVAKCAYDKSLIKSHTNSQAAETAKADRKADNTAAVQRVEDVTRVNDEAQEIKETVNEARNEGRDPRAAYYECVRLQQAARRERKPSPSC